MNLFLSILNVSTKSVKTEDPFITHANHISEKKKEFMNDLKRRIKTLRSRKSKINKSAYSGKQQIKLIKKEIKEARKMIKNPENYLSDYIEEISNKDSEESPNDQEICSDSEILSDEDE